MNQLIIIYLEIPFGTQTLLFLFPLHDASVRQQSQGLLQYLPPLPLFDSHRLCSAIQWKEIGPYVRNLTTAISRICICFLSPPAAIVTYCFRYVALPLQCNVEIG
jgi:hypothetical protein